MSSPFQDSAADTGDRSAPRIAVLIPCRDEAASIATVVRDFRSALPTAAVYVYDNASTDLTAEIARTAGAIVRREHRAGKGIVVQRMFADVEADIYVMVDGDNTYEAAAAPRLVELLVESNFDMVIGRRVSELDVNERRGHVLGNRFFNWLHSFLFGSGFQDVFSGYRVFSRRFVKSFPATATGFETEAELTVHALDIMAPWAEVPTAYSGRGPDSESKLRTYRDALRILGRSLLLYKEMRPARFFGFFCGLFGILGFVLAIPLIEHFAETGQVPRFPTAILAASLELLAALCLAAGIILDSIARRHREIKRLHYLQYDAPAEGSQRISESEQLSAFH